MRTPFLLVATLLSVIASPALGQSSQPVSKSPTAAAPAAESTPAPQATSPDIVRTHAGGIFRGTISEYVPGEYVVIVLASGESRRIGGADVAYAGAAAAEPTTAPTAAPATPPVPVPAAPVARDPSEVRPLITVQAKTAGVHFEADPSGVTDSHLTLYMRTGTATAVGSGGTAIAESFTRICAAPCDAELAEGTYTFGLGRDDEPAVKVDGMQTVRPGQRLVGRYESRMGVRVAGLVIMIGGIGVGTAVMLSGDATSNGSLIGGAVIMGAGAILGLILGRQSDQATLTAQ